MISLFGKTGVNIFTFIILLAVIWIFISQRSLKKQYLYILVISCALDITSLQGYFIIFNASEVAYENAFSVILLFFSIIVMIKLRKSRKILVYLGIFLMAGLAGFLMEKVIPYRGNIISYDAVLGWDGYINGITSKLPVHISNKRFLLIYVRLLAYGCAAYNVRIWFRQEDYCKIFRILSKILSFQVYYGMFELISKNIFRIDITNTINGMLFGVGSSTYSGLMYRSGFAQLQGFTREPAHFAMALFYSVIIFLINEKLHNKRIEMRAILVIILLVASRSFAAVVYLLVIFAFVLYLKGRISEKRFRKVFMGIFKFLCIIFVLLFFWVGNASEDSDILNGFIAWVDRMLGDSYLSNRFMNVIKNLRYMLNGTWMFNMGTSSELVRLVSIVDTFKDFLRRPVFGLGAGIQTAHGAVVTMLSDIGIVGTVFWWKLATYSEERRDYFFIAVLLIIAPNLFCGSINALYSVMTLLLIGFADCYYKKMKEKTYVV